MPTEKYMIFADINTNEENIVDMDKGEPLTINQICKLLNNINKENQQLKDENWKLKRAKQDLHHQNSRLRVFIKEHDLNLLE